MFIYVPSNIPLGVSMFVRQFVCLIIACTSTFFCISVEDDGIGWFGVLGGQFVSVVFAYYDTATAEC